MNPFSIFSQLNDWSPFITLRRSRWNVLLPLEKNEWAVTAGSGFRPCSKSAEGKIPHCVFDKSACWQGNIENCGFLRQQHWKREKRFFADNEGRP